MSDWPLIATGVLAGSAALYLRLSSPKASSRAAQGRVEADKVDAEPVGDPPAPNFLPVAGYDRLVAKMGVAGRIAKIQQRLAFSPDNYKRDVLPVLQQFTEFVQLLPASESHHHAQPGGLLVHLIEVADYALHFRDSYKLPLGATTEDQMRLAARYSYAIFVAALLHDIGKPVADVSIMIAGKAFSTARQWVAMAGNMSEQGAVWYSVDFPSARDYDAHKRLPVILLQRFVPDSAMSWLGEEPKLLQDLMGYLAGDRDGGAIAEIVSRADRRSVADNLLTGPRTRFASARSVPLIERLMTATRRIIADGGLSMNRAGATGYVDGDSLWCVAGTVAKAVREYLNQNETRTSGAAGIPEDNTRLFDTWQEYGAIVTTPTGGAIWNISVRIGEWEQAFTVLRFPLSMLYQDPSKYPQKLPEGALRVLTGATATVAAASRAPSAASAIASTNTAAAPPTESTIPPASTDPASSTAAPATEPTPAPTPVEPAENANPLPADPGIATASKSTQQDASEPVVDDGYPAFDEAPATPPAAHPAAEQVTEPYPEFLDDNDSAAAVQPAQPVEAPPEAVSAPVRPKERQSRAPTNSVSGKAGPKIRPNAERFMAWIQQGVGTGSIKYNESSAFIHFLDEGMLVVSPRAFQEYASQHPSSVEQDGDKPIEPWRAVQRDFQRSGFPQKGEGGTFMHYYTVSGPGGKRLVGNLVVEPVRFFTPVPASNPLIQSKTSTPT